MKTDAVKTAPGPKAPVLSVRGLSVRFRMRGGRQVAAVADAHFDLVAGSAWRWSARAAAANPCWPRRCWGCCPATR